MSMRVPFTRTMRLGDHGRDVSAMQQALKASGVRPGPPTAQYRDGTRDQVAQFQREHGIAGTGVYGERTHDQLDHYYPDDAARVMRDVKHDREVAAMVERLMNVCAFAVERRDDTAYSQDRPMEDMAPPPNIPRKMDCSSGVTWVMKSAGARDPNGRGYDGWGYTGTLLENGWQVALSRLKRGDLVFYRDPEHVAMYIGQGLVWSNGSDAGPLILPTAYRDDILQARRYIRR